ncbi:MAG TPA: ACT domain-containing protein [Vicinamibacteria bacterium]|nr:ACT domain-containing protein [Vicinamibacteria bacterium]
MERRALTLELLAGRYAVARLDAAERLPAWAGQGPFVSITRTDAELSIVCPQEAVPPAARAERGWCCLRVAGPLGFGVTGILASLAGPLASSGVSIFVVSTYDTDYLMLQERDLDRGLDALSRAGHTLVR